MLNWDVFLSYSSVDREKAELLRDDLRNAGLTVWFDQDFVKYGDRIRQAIEYGIVSSQLLLLLVSVHSLRSPWVLNELDAGMLREIDDRKVFVLPVLIGRIELQALPHDIRGKKFIDLRYRFARRYAAKRDRLITAIQQGLNTHDFFHASTVAPPGAARVAVDRERARRRVIMKLGGLASDTIQRDAGRPDLPSRESGEEFLFTALPIVLARFRDSEPAIIVFDVDGLTGINARFGQSVGDAVLVEIARVLRSNNDLTYSGRCGDDTFYAIVERGQNAGRIAKAVHEQIRHTPWSRIASGLYVTVSSGIATVNPDEDARDWVIRAVQGMVGAKREGRDIVMPAPLHIAPTASRNIRDYCS